VRLYGAWELQGWGQPEDYRFGENFFPHESLPEGYSERYFSMVRQHGRSVIGQMARVRYEPFTFTECMRQTRPNGPDRWIFNFLRQEGIRDGLLCCSTGWIVVYWSSRLLDLSWEERSLLDFMAVMAASYLRARIEKRKRPRKRPELTAREQSVLQHLANGMTATQIAARLDVSEPTVRTFLARARRRLAVQTNVQAVAEAMRRMLIR
jgi:DNA-binding CsgD family transcriptional regulator